MLEHLSGKVRLWPAKQIFSHRPVATHMHLKGESGDANTHTPPPPADVTTMPHQLLQPHVFIHQIVFKCFLFLIYLSSNSNSSILGNDPFDWLFEQPYRASDCCQTELVEPAVGPTMAI